MQKQKFLTKSRYVNGLQCSKWIWLAFNRPEELPKIDEITQNRFDEGHKVGELAKKLFPNGIEIFELDPLKNSEKTKSLLKDKEPLFFLAENVSGILAYIHKKAFGRICPCGSLYHLIANRHFLMFRHHVDKI